MAFEAMGLAPPGSPSETFPWSDLTDERGVA